MLRLFRKKGLSCCEVGGCCGHTEYALHGLCPPLCVHCKTRGDWRMKYLGVAGVLLGLSLLGVPALADEAKQPVPRVGQVVIESMGPASGTIPKGKLATIVNYSTPTSTRGIKMVPGTRPSIPLIRVRSGICTTVCPQDALRAWRRLRRAFRHAHCDEQFPVPTAPSRPTASAARTASATPRLSCTSSF